MSATPKQPQRHLISALEYLRMGEAGVFSSDVRLELMEGEIIEMAPIGSAHAAVVNRLAAILNRSCGESALVSVQNPIVAGDRSVPQPDLALLMARSDGYFRQHPMAPEVLLVVEVSDTTLRFDLGKKVPLYCRAGIAETWVIDVDLRTVHVFRDPSADGYRTCFTVSTADRVNLHRMPLIAVGVASLFPV